MDGRMRREHEMECNHIEYVLFTKCHSIQLSMVYEEHGKGVWAIPQGKLFQPKKSLSQGGVPTF